MSADLPVTDELLRAMLERRARRGIEDGLRAPILATTRVTRQDRFRPRALRGGRAPLRLLAVAALLLGVAGAGLALVAGQRPPAPDHHMVFLRPFDYRLVDGVPSETPLHDGGVLAFTVGGTEPFPRTEDGHMVPGSHGITMTTLEVVITHPCPTSDGGASRVVIRNDPAGFLADLRAVGGVGVGDPRPVTFDGRPSLIADVDPSTMRCEAADFHLDHAGIGSSYVLVNMPSRLLVTEVDGLTVVIQVWADSPDGMAAWLPTATKFLDGIRFAAVSVP